MYTKRSAIESSRDERTNEEGSDPEFQQDGNVKKATLTELSDTTLQDLPIELLQCILVKVVVSEVCGMKLAKSVWEEKAGPVISRLRPVCSLWSDLLTTKSFRKEVNRNLDKTAQGTTCLDMQLHCRINLPVFRVAASKDELFMLSKPTNEEPFINVYDRNNVPAVKDVIPLPGIDPWGMVASCPSNCLYVLRNESHGLSVLRIARDEELQFNVAPWINTLSLPLSLHRRMFIAVDGSLIILTDQNLWNPYLVSIYDATGFLKQEVMLYPEIHGFRDIPSVFQRSNGNLVLECFADETIEMILKEIDATTGSIVRQYQSPIDSKDRVIVGDVNGRIFILGSDDESELLDSELNPLPLTADHHGQVYDYSYYVPCAFLYNADRNEIVRLQQIVIDYDDDDDYAFMSTCLTVFRIREE